LLWAGEGRRRRVRGKGGQGKESKDLG